MEFQELLYKQVSLWIGIISLVATIVATTFYFAGTVSQLALLNQKLDNHITHISTKVDEMSVIQDKQSENMTLLKIDIVKILEHEAKDK